MNRAVLRVGLLLLTTTPVMAIDLEPLWDFKRPELSEQRFKAALEKASGDDTLILQTQIARTHGLRKNFDAARQLLGQIEAPIAKAGPEAQVRWQLELGRSFASASHSPEQLTTDGKARARKAFEAALAGARAAGLDALAIDAIHMFAFLDTAPADQLKWGLAALEVVQASSQPAAKRWEASVRHNVGYALHQLGRFDEALAQFQQALALREKGSNAGATRVAHWMVAWTLRSLKRLDEALVIQLSLEREYAAVGQPDRHVFEELAALYKAQGDAARAEHYAQLKAAASKQ